MNTQTNSANLGFNPITKYERVDYACIHEGELRLALHTRFSDLYEIADVVRKKLKAKRFMVTRGPNGSVLFSDDGAIVESPALSMKIVDRVGAGDAFFAITAPCVFKNYEADLVGLIGNCVGALAVELSPADVARISEVVPPGAAAGTRYPAAQMKAVFI